LISVPVFSDEAKSGRSQEEITLDIQIKTKSLEKLNLNIQETQKSLAIQDQQIRLNDDQINMIVQGRIYERGMHIEDKTVNLYLETMDYSSFWRNLQIVKITKPDILRIHLFSFGGSAFDAMAMIGLIEEIQKNGTIIEMRAKGLAASAGLILLVSGTPGHRYLDKNSMVMFHELQSLTMRIDTPTSKEEEARVLRKIQDKVSRYISSKTKMSFNELSEKIRSKELWYDAEEAIAVGFADKIE
jgi:ATP-dependent protease ClpP protease subunit